MLFLGKAWYGAGFADEVTSEVLARAAAARRCCSIAILTSPWSRDACPMIR